LRIGGPTSPSPSPSVLQAVTVRFLSRSDTENKGKYSIFNKKEGEIMYMNIKCSICGSKFNSSRHNAKYCSPECKIEGQKQVKKRWEEAHPDYDKNRMKAYRDKQKRPMKEWKH